MTTAPPHPAAAAAAANPVPPWHLARSLEALRAAVDAHWPNRDKRSDGGIGDARHQAEGAGSDHNPWLSSPLGPAVRAFDFTATQPGVNGVDGAWLAECLRIAGAAGDHRLAGQTGSTDDNGYVIFNGHITAPDFSRWVPYSGSDAHTTHVHVSVTRDPAGFEDSSPWAFLTQTPQHPPAPAHHDATGHGDTFRAEAGDQGPEVQHLQHDLNRFAPAYSHLDEDGIYGEQTAAVVKEFDHRAGNDPALHADHDALEAADGENVGPAGARALSHYGLL